MKQLEIPQVRPTIQMSIEELQNLCHQNAKHAGWWDDYQKMPDEYKKYFLASRYSLFHSELSEGLEGLRKHKADSHLTHRPAEEVELADLLIRVFDYAGAMNMDLAGAIVEKIEYNKTRPDHTRDARAAEGGKSI